MKKTKSRDAWTCECNSSYGPQCRTVHRSEDAARIHCDALRERALRQEGTHFAAGDYVPSRERLPH